VARELSGWILGKLNAAQRVDKLEAEGRGSYRGRDAKVAHHVIGRMSDVRGQWQRRRDERNYECTQQLTVGQAMATR